MGNNKKTNQMYSSVAAAIFATAVSAQYQRGYGGYQQQGYGQQRAYGYDRSIKSPATDFEFRGETEDKARDFENKNDIDVKGGFENKARGFEAGQAKTQGPKTSYHRPQIQQVYGSPKIDLHRPQAQAYAKGPNPHLGVKGPQAHLSVHRPQTAVHRHSKQAYVQPAKKPVKPVYKQPQYHGVKSYSPPRPHYGGYGKGAW